MKKTILFLAVSAFVGFLGLGSIASADDVMPGAYVQHDSSVMGVGKTMMQMGAATRTITNATNLSSQAGRSRSSVGINTDYQFGSSQSEQSWKAAKTVEEAEYLGSLLSRSISALPEIKRRMGLGYKRAEDLKRLWRGTGISRKRKIELFIKCWSNAKRKNST